MVALTKSTNAIASIAALIASPRIDRYVVGITLTPSTRRSSYRREGFDLYFTLEHGMDLAEALSLERAVFGTLLESKKKLTHKKYQPDKRDSTYRSSSGGKKAEGKSYSLYVAACTNSTSEA